MCKNTIARALNLWEKVAVLQFLLLPSLLFTLLFISSFPPAEFTPALPEGEAFRLCLYN